MNLEQICDVEASYWNPDKDITIAKDKVKKEGLFLRERIPSRLDEQIEPVFQKLLEMYRLDSIHKFRLLFGSNLIEVKFRCDPFCAQQYPLELFLQLDPDSRFGVQECHHLTIGEIAESLEAMKKLRFLPREFIEAYRINSFSGKVWCYFSSASSIIVDNALFLRYVELRTSRGSLSLRHDEALKALKLSDGADYFQGDAEFYLSRQRIFREITDHDVNIDLFNEAALGMFQKNQIFEIQNYLGSGVYRVVPTAEPYTTYAFHTVGEFVTASRYFNKPAMSLDQALENSKLQIPERKSNLLAVAASFEVAKQQRLHDNNLYLRVLYEDFLYDKVLSSFSCGGTRYQRIEDFITEFAATDAEGEIILPHAHP